MASVAFQDVSLISADAGGLGYGLITSGEWQGSIVVFDLRDKLVEQQQASSLSLREVQPCSILHPKPALTFAPSGLVAAPGGRYLSVYGYDHEEEDQAVVVVIDVHGGQPHTEPSSSAAAPSPSMGRRATSSPSPAASDKLGGVRHKDCAAHVVHYSLFASRPGLLIRQLLWHPYSESHLLVLTSDSRGRLYHVNNLQQPETSLHLQCSSDGRTGSGKYGLGAASTSDEAVAVAWGSNTGWGVFTLYVQSRTGGMYAVCPLAPAGMRCSASTLQQAMVSAEEGADEDAHADRVMWLHAAFGVQDTNQLRTESWWTVRPHVMEGQAPALQGPLNASCESLKSPASTSSVAIAALHHQYLPAAQGGRTELSSTAQASAQQVKVACTTALVSAQHDGRLWAHLLLQPVGPCWSGAQPRVEYSSAGSVLSTRYDCTSDPASPAFGSAVLIDAIDLNLSPNGTEEEEEVGSLQLSTLSAAGSHVVLASHSTGSWAVGIPWLPAASKYLSKRQQGRSTGAPLLPPPSVQELVLCGHDGSSRQLLSAASIQDVLVGRLALLLQEPGVLQCVRPGAALAGAEAPPLEAAPTTKQGAPATPGTAGAAAAGNAGKRERQPEGRSKEVVESAIQAVYGDLLAPPAAPALPSPQQGSAPGATQGAAYLSAAIRAMRQGGVEVAHRTHAGLLQRAGQLDKEAGAQKAAVEELKALYASVAEKQTSLKARADRALSLYANLAERAALLTQLHWSLPRPLSEAEQQLSADLEVMAARQGALAKRWTGVRGRAEKALQHAQHSGGGPAGLDVVPASSSKMVPAAVAAGRRPPPAMSVPAAQLGPVHAALRDHVAAISQCSAEVARMQQHVKTWKEQTAASQAEVHLGSGAWI